MIEKQRSEDERRERIARDARWLEIWRSVSGPQAALTGPLIRFAAQVEADLLASPAVSPSQEGAEEWLPSPEPRKVMVYRPVVRPVRAVPNFRDESPAISREPEATLLTEQEVEWVIDGLERKQMTDRFIAKVRATLSSPPVADQGVREAPAEPQACGWQPISTAPWQGEHIIVWTPANLCWYAVARHGKDDKWGITGGGPELYHEPTLWMRPLAPPVALAPAEGEAPK